VTINLNPATLPKPAVITISRSSQPCSPRRACSEARSYAEQLLLGELGRDGRLRPVRGILPATLAAQQARFTRVIVPLRQAGEAQLVEGIEVFGVTSITQLVACLQGIRCRPLSPSK
jgi:magnesium chelatase family protein